MCVIAETITPEQVAPFFSPRRGSVDERRRVFLAVTFFVTTKNVSKRHTKPLIVIPVVGIVPVAVRTAEVTCFIVPRTTTHNAALLFVLPLQFGQIAPIG